MGMWMGQECVLAVQLCFYALERRDGEEGFCDAGSKSSDHGPGPGDLAIGVFEEGFVEIECDEA